MTDNPTLESLDARLTRLIQEWKEAQDSPEFNVRTVADRRLAEFIAFHPEMIKANPFWDQPLANDLLALPGRICELQAVYDEADKQFECVSSFAALDALDATLFKDKNGEVRPASNDTERRIAIEFHQAHAPDVSIATDKRAESLRNLQAAKNRFEAARLLVALITKGNGR